MLQDHAPGARPAHPFSIGASHPTMAHLAANRPARASVLLIEDDAILRRVLTIVLEGAEYAVTTVGSASHARAAAREGTGSVDGSVDLIVCDLHLPDGRGDRLAHELIPLLTPRALLLLSGAGLPADVVTSHPAHAPRFGFLQKPFDGDDLLDRIQALLA